MDFHATDELGGFLQLVVMPKGIHQEAGQEHEGEDGDEGQDEGIAQGIAPTDPEPAFVVRDVPEDLFATVGMPRIFGDAFDQFLEDLLVDGVPPDNAYNLAYRVSGNAGDDKRLLFLQGIGAGEQEGGAKDACRDGIAFLERLELSLKPIFSHGSFPFRRRRKASRDVSAIGCTKNGWFR